MRLVKPTFLAVLAMALVGYAFDCGATATPEQAAQCCDSMSCSSQGHHGMECCKTMPSVRTPFVQPSSVQGVSHAPLVFAVLPASAQIHNLDSSSHVVPTHSHAPPIPDTARQPLRI